MISKGDTLPEATLFQMGNEGPEEIQISNKTKGRKVVIFAVPAAFSGTCTSAHVPSFMRTKHEFEALGVDEVICISVNDPFVMSAWGEHTGATEAGLTMLSDAASEFTRAIGLDFDAPQAGMFGRSKRYAMFVEDSKVVALNLEENPAICQVSSGEGLLDAIRS